MEESTIRLESESSTWMLKEFVVLIIKRRVGETEVETFEITEDQLKQYKTVSASSGQPSSNKEAIDLYKMEYERCAQRYDDLYKAAWTNFSYIALIAGAILTFGSDSFMTELSIFVATLPLLFWWIASFETLNRYADQVQTRAGLIEKLINKLVDFGKKGDPSKQEKTGLDGQKGLRHFQDFGKRDLTIKWRHLIPAVLCWISLLVIVLQRLFALSNVMFWIALLAAIVFLFMWWSRKYKDAPSDAPNRLWRHMLRVRLIVRMFAGAIIIVAICAAYAAYQQHQPPYNKPYIKSKLESKLPERLTIQIEK